MELGQLEREDERGVILSTGQYIRFLATMAAGVVQAVLVNGPKTNSSDCEISIMECWSWGLSVTQYYQVLAAVLHLGNLAFATVKLQQQDDGSSEGGGEFEIVWSKEAADRIN